MLDRYERLSYKYKLHNLQFYKIRLNVKIILT